jgi:hypothetical protein
LLKTGKGESANNFAAHRLIAYNDNIKMPTNMTTYIKVTEIFILPDLFIYDVLMFIRSH